MEKSLQKTMVRFYYLMAIRLVLDIGNCIFLFSIYNFYFIHITLGILCFMNLVLIINVIKENYKKHYIEEQQLLEILKWTMPMIFVPEILFEFQLSTSLIGFRTTQNVFGALIITSIIMFRVKVIRHYRELASEDKSYG